MIKRRKSILFVNPDYHCSFILKDEFRNNKWKADVFCPPWYPKKLLYKDDAIKYFNPKQAKNWFVKKFSERYINWIHLLYAICHYKYLFCYGSIDYIHFKIDKKLKKKLGNSFRLALFITKMLGSKIIYLPSGCNDRETKANFLKFDNGNVCNNCGYSDGVCDDIKNNAKFQLTRKYTHLVVGGSNFDSSQFKETHFRYKSLDLDLWSPSLKIPNKYVWAKTDKIRILHSFYDKNRLHKEKNIKGTPFVVSAIEKLQQEGYDIEYIYLNKIKSKEIRFYQSQVDIVVEQLIYGWWGSSGIECMALGKPVICYLRKEWKEFFLQTYPEYNSLPIIEANTENIYQVLKKTIINTSFRKKKGKESREFALKHYDVKKNVKEMEELLFSL